MEPGPDVFFDLEDLLAISQCNTYAWKAVGELVAAVSERKGSLNIGFGDQGVFVLQEWDDRAFANNDGRLMVNGDL